MKTSKLAVLGFSFAVVLAFAGIAGAQDNSAPATPPPSAAPSGSSSGGMQSGRPHKMNAEMIEDDPSLNLTDDQKTKIAGIRSDTKDQMKAINKDTTLSDTDKQAKMKELHKTTRAQIFGVLTPEQQKQAAADMRAARQAKRAGGSPE